MVALKDKPTRHKTSYSFISLNKHGIALWQWIDWKFEFPDFSRGIVWGETWGIYRLKYFFFESSLLIRINQWCYDIISHLQIEELSMYLSSCV